MFAETAFQDPEVLFEDNWIVLRKSGQTAVLESQAWSNPQSRTLSIAALIGWIICFVWAWANYSKSSGTANLVLAIVSSITLPLGLGYFIQSRFPRRFDLDFDSRLCHFSNVPGFEQDIPFGEIDSITILRFGSDTTVALTRCVTTHSLRIHLFKNVPLNAERGGVNASQLADTLSQLLGCPTNVIVPATIIGAMRRMSWR